MVQSVSMLMQMVLDEYIDRVVRLKSDWVKEKK